MVKTVENISATTKEVVLSGSLSLKAAGMIRQQLLQALDEGGNIKLLLQDIEDIDLSLIQLICAAHRSAMHKNKTLIMQDTLPDEFVEIVEDAGLNSHVGCSSDGRDHCVWRKS